MKFTAIASSIIILLIVAALDYVTGFELLFHLFYFIPVAIAAWYGGRRSAWVMAGFAAVIWVVVDYCDDHQYSWEFFRYWNAGMFFASFAIVGELLVRLREALEAVKKCQAEKEEALRALERAGRKASGPNPGS